MTSSPFTSISPSQDMGLQLEKLVKFEFLLFLLCLRFVQNISVYGTDERVKLDFDLNKTPQENGMMEGHSKAYVNIIGKQKIDKSVESIKPFKPKRRSPRIESFLDEQGQCILHRPKCDHWKDLNPSERAKEHGKFNRMMMTPEERRKERERLSRIPKDPEREARYNKKWYKKRKANLTGEEIKEKKQKANEISRKHRVRRRMGLPVRKYASRTTKMSGSANSIDAS